MAASPPVPPAGGRLLSGYGTRRGRRGGAIEHPALDIGHPEGRGTPILAIQGGTVERVGREESRLPGLLGYGNAAVVNHGDGTWALYAHMDVLGVVQGQHVEAGDQLGTMGNTMQGQYPGMPVHLHLELRRGQPGGTSPFPARPGRFNIDPRPWIEGKGLRFLARGGFEILPGTEMAQTQPVWEALGSVGATYADGLHSTVAAARFAILSRSALGDAYDAVASEYEPPARFDRDVRFGLSPIEWAAVGGAGLILGGTGAGLLVRYLRRRRMQRSTV